jgi:hypothetical protein
MLVGVPQLRTCIRKHGNVFITWFIHSMYAKV